MNTLERFSPRLRAVSLAAGLLAAASATWAAAGDPSPAAIDRAVLVAGDSWIVEKTTTLASLKIEPGALVAAPVGRSLTMTVDGVETGIRPGAYRGQVVLSVTDLDPVKFSDRMTHHFRQALYIDADGVVPARSVEAAAGDFTVREGVVSGARIRSNGDNFNGIVVGGGTWTVKGLRLDFEGNGGNDFAGYGAGVMSTGKGTTLILDGARVATHGVVRTTVIGNGGSNLIVKNSDIVSRTGVLPADYRSNVTPGEMKDAPWMLGIKGNVRATNVLGDNTTCTYINSHLASDGWGVLSIDMSRDTRLTAIDSVVELTGDAGYGSYSIGNATNSFYGTTMRVPTYGLIITGGHAVFGASTAANVAAVDADVHLHMSAAELSALPVRQTVVDSARFGVMMWGDATVRIQDATVFDTGEAVFLDKGAASVIDVDGSAGATLHSRNGVIFQAMDNDDPGPRPVGDLMLNDGVYRDPVGAPDRLKDFDVVATHKSDMVATFSHISLQGDFYNAVRDIAVGGGMDENGVMHAPTGKAGQNLVLSFDDAKLAGRITASSAKHRRSPITSADYQALGEVVNTPSAAVNNGVVVSLSRTAWSVTSTSYLTSLTLDEASSVTGSRGRKLTLLVDGVVTPIKAGRYTGNVVLKVGG